MSGVKNSIVLDKFNKGILINKNREIDYTTNIIVECDKDSQFEYAIVDESNLDDNFIPYVTAKKYAIIKHANTDGIYKKKLLMLRSQDRCNASVTINIDSLMSAHNTLETLGPRGTVLLSTVDTPGTEKKPWYKEPTNIAIILMVVAFIAFMLMSNSRSGRARGGDRSLFID